MPRNTLAIPLALLLAAQTVLAEPQAGHVIRGKVRTATGATVRHAVVMLHAGVGGMVSQAVTNEEGDFAFAGLTGVSYTIVINHPGHEAFSESVTFTRPAGEGQPGEIKTSFVTLEATAPARTPSARVVFVQNVPAEARAAYDRGATLSKQNKPEDAITAYKEATAAFRDYFDAHLALGNELMRTNRLAEATRSLEAARGINPRDDRVYAAFGLVMIRERKFAVAAAVFGEAARIRPDESSYPFMRAGALIDQARALSPTAADRPGLLEAAESDLARAYELSGRMLSGVRLQRARLYEQRGDHARAAAELDLYLRENPGAQNATAIRDAIRELRAKR
jgi:Tfp pilus assembly protein PilF